MRLAGKAMKVVVIYNPPKPGLPSLVGSFVRTPTPFATRLTVAVNSSNGISGKEWPRCPGPARRRADDQNAGPLQSVPGQGEYANLHERYQTVWLAASLRLPDLDPLTCRGKFLR